MKYPISILLVLIAVLNSQVVCLAQQNTGVQKVSASTNATSSKEKSNMVSFTLTESNGQTRTIQFKSQPTNSTDYFNAAVVDKTNMNNEGSVLPRTKIWLTDKSQPNNSFSMSFPITNTGSTTATYQSDYDNEISFTILLNGYRISPQEIAITITKWDAVNGLIEGSFSGKATIVDVNKIYDNDSIPTCTISDGKFSMVRLKDQTSYGGE